MAGSHEIRGEVIFIEQDSTCTLIQFSIALSIKTWNCFSEFQWPTRSRHPSNRPLRTLNTFRQPCKLIHLQIQSDVFFFSYFFCYVVNRLSSSMELKCDFRNTWQNHIWKQNQESIAAIILINILFLFWCKRNSVKFTFSFIERNGIIVIICNGFRHW